MKPGTVLADLLERAPDATVKFSVIAGDEGPVYRLRLFGTVGQGRGRGFRLLGEWCGKSIAAAIRAALDGGS